MIPAAQTTSVVNPDAQTSAFKYSFLVPMDSTPLQRCWLMFSSTNNEKNEAKAFNQRLKGTALQGIFPLTFYGLGVAVVRDWN